MSRSNITQQQDFHRWPYLRGVHLLHIDRDVELFIGLNIPRALEPVKVITSEDGPVSGGDDCEHHHF